MSRRLITSTAALVLLALGAAGPASAKPRDCPKRANMISVKPLGRVWHERASVYACTTVYAHKPVARRMGPWTKQTRLAFDGVDLAWTTRVVRGGVPYDRVWAGSADTGKRWQSGARLVPASASTPAREARIARIVQRDTGAAWTTTAGDVVFALPSPDADPSPVGTLPGPLSATKGVLLVGTFPTSDHAGALAASMTLTEGDGEGDECGGSNPYSLRVTPDPAAPAVGADWSSSWTSTNC